MATSLLITGGSGFVGRHLIPLAQAQGFSVSAPSRAALGDLSGRTDWRAWLSGIDCVIHLAGRAHIMQETLGAADVEKAFQQVNAEAVAQLASQSVTAGVRRFVLVSSAKVFGESGHFCGADMAQPQEAYGRSKAEGERALIEATHGASSTMSYAILRPPVIYGPGVKGNIARLDRLARSGFPLPLGGINNQRSMIGLENFCDALLHATLSPQGIYAPSDQDNVSTSEFLRRLIDAKAYRCPLFSVPDVALRAALRLAGKGIMIPRLMGDFTVDGALPGWTPKMPMIDQLKAL